MDRAIAEQLELARQGDVDAFAYVATAFRDQLVAWARPLTSGSHEAEDAAQEALLAAFKLLHELRETDAFPAWLRMLLRTAAMRQHRRKRPDLVEAPEPAADEGDAVESAELRHAVQGAVKELPATHQALIEAHYMRGEGLAEIAGALGLPLGTVKRRLHEAREKLRGKLAGFGRAGDDTWRPS
jgi:RNA polymerase sigma factor (sigma-70 family)